MARGPKPRPKPANNGATHLAVPEGMQPDAATEWTRIVEILASQKVLSELDIAALTIYANSYASYTKAQRHVDEHGEVVIGTTGTPIKNPYLTVQKECWERIRPLLAEFGLTPSARARLHMTHCDDAEKDDDFMELR
jgi:P27 family predicted phage terminase small subunit